MADILLPEFPQGSLAHVGGLQSLMTVTSLFTDMAGNIPFLITSYYKAMKIKELLLLFTTTRTTLITIMLNERSRTQKIIFGMIPFRR